MTLIKIGPAFFDPINHVLIHKKKEIPLPSIPYKIINLLSDGKLKTREQIANALGHFDSFDPLLVNHYIYLLRKNFKQIAKQIVTVSLYGYRLSR